MKADLVVTGAGRLVTCSSEIGEGALGVVERGALAAHEGTVLWVGRENDLGGNVEALPGATEIDARGGVVMPGLVDCHTHLVFAGDRSAEYAARLRGEPYRAGGVRATVEATRAASNDELATLARARLDRFMMFGVTTIEAKSGYGLAPDQERRLLEVGARLGHTVEVVRTFMGAHVVPDEWAGDGDGYVRQVCETIRGIGGLAEFCDVWIDEGAFTPAQARTILRAAKVDGLGIKVHAEQLARTGGAQVAAEFGAVSCDHLEHVNDDDADALKRAGTVAVLLPGASMQTGGPFAPARMLIERGVRVAVSTDFNPGTSYSENLPLAAALACAHLSLTMEEAVLGVTRNAAAALSRERTHGWLGPGSVADLVVLDAPHEAELAYHYGAAAIRTVLKGSRAETEAAASVGDRPA